MILKASFGAKPHRGYPGESYYLVKIRGQGDLGLADPARNSNLTEGELARMSLKIYVGDEKFHSTRFPIGTPSGGLGGDDWDRFARGWKRRDRFISRQFCGDSSWAGYEECDGNDTPFPGPCYQSCQPDCTCP